MSEYRRAPTLDSLPLFAPTHRDGPDTEQLAAAKINPRLATLRKLVIDLARARGAMGVTPDEVISHYEMDGQETSVRPRLSELCLSKHGCVLTRTTKRRQNRRSNFEAVYVLTEP